MDVLLRTAVFLWILVGFPPLPKMSAEACAGNDFPGLCDIVFRNVCLEFAEELNTWSQARRSCEKQGGELLKVMNNPIKTFLKTITRERNTSNFTWWLGKGIQGEPTIKNGEVSKYNCPYMKLNPPQLIMTSDCSQRRSFLCSHNLPSTSDTKNTVVSGHTSRSRLKRDDNNIEIIFQQLQRDLLNMETTAREPSYDKASNVLQRLMTVANSLTSKPALQKIDAVDRIVKYSNAIYMLSQKNCGIQTDQELAFLFDQVLKIMWTVSVLLDPETSQKIVIKHPKGSFYLSKFTPAELNSVVMGSEEDEAHVKLPSYSALKGQLGEQGTVIAQMITFSDNPYPSDDNISGAVCSLSLSNGVSEIKLANLTEMIEIFMAHPKASAPTNSTVVLEKDKKTLIAINVSDPNSTIIFSVETSANVSLILTLSQGSPPNSTYSSSTTILGPTDSRWMITPEMLQQTPGLWYIDTSIFNSTWEPGLTLTITSFMSKCFYWNTERYIWSTHGCRVGEKSTPERTQCLCNHLTLFGSSFFVVPNHIDISQTAALFATVSENYVVLALLCAFFSLYLVTLLWACYADRKSHSKRKMTLLEDNHPGAQYNYLVSVQTGHRKNAGTTANVTVKLIGSEAETNTHNLTDPDKPVFERGAVDMFLLAAPFPLGEVRNLRLQHDNSGGHPSWYINKVTIQDLQTHHVWHFFCDCWLSEDRGDGMTKKTFNAAKNNEVASFRNIFRSRTSTGFRDEHIWVSIVDPPSRSPFTRAQRVSCCMSLLLCTMAINIAFWNIPVDSNSPVIFSLGSLQITWQEIMVGVESGLLMFPINILIITIFRSIRPRIILKSKKDCEDSRPLIVTIPTILKDTEEVISLVSRSPRNKMSETRRLESHADLYPALNRIHEFIQLMQGQTESDLHWVYCSKFLLAGLCHLLISLEKVDIKNFPTAPEYQQSLSITNLLVRKTEMVFSCHLTSCPPLVKKRKKRSGGCWLPWWCVFLGWFLLLSISGLSTFFTLLYGFQYGKEKSIKWVMSLGLSLFQSIFILQPLKVIGLAVFFALLLKPVAVEETEEIEQVLLEQQDRCRLYSGRDTL